MYWLTRTLTTNHQPTTTMANDTANGTNESAAPFDIDMPITSTLPQGGGGFAPASAIDSTTTVKRSTCMVKMPYNMPRGMLVKRLATILLPRHRDIAILPHTSATHDKIVDHELVPTDESGISHFIFDEKSFVRKRGTRLEHTILEFKFHIESPITISKMKYTPAILELLKKHEIYIIGKAFTPAFDTKPVGLLMNLDPRKCAKNEIIELLKADVEIELDKEVFIDLEPHRGLVRLGKTVIFGEFLKVMVEVANATEASTIIRTGLKNKTFGIGLKDARLMPMYPIPNVMSPETFGQMIVAHNKSMHGIAEIQIDHVWEINDPSTLSDTVKAKFLFPTGPDHAKDTFTLKKLLMTMLWGAFDDQPKVRDMYVMRGRLMIVCEKSVVAEATCVVDQMIVYLKEHFDVGRLNLDENAEKFADWVGCLTPKNHFRHPARTGTLLYGEESLLKAEVGSFLDKNLKSLTDGLVPLPGQSARKPDLRRPPRVAMYSRGRAKPIVNPAEFTPAAVNAWSQAKKWAAPITRKQSSGTKRNSQKATKAAPEVIELDGGTDSTTSMSSGTQAALDEMRKSMERMESEKKTNNDKIVALDNSLAQIARNVAAMYESQRKTSSDYVAIKEQIVSSAKDIGSLKNDLLEMKQMMSTFINANVANRNDQVNLVSQSSLSQAAASIETPAAGLTQPSSQPDFSDDEDMTMAGKSGSPTTDSDKNKKARTAAPASRKDAFPAILNRANHPQLLPSVAAPANGPTGNLTTFTDQDLEESMYD